MIEIIVLIFISRGIGETAQDKGYSKGLYRFFTFLICLGFEFIGAVIGTILLGGEEAGVYLIALVSAGIGLLIIYLVVEFLPDMKVNDLPIYIVNGATIPVYEKTIESSKVIKELKKGEILEINTTTDFGRFFKVQISPAESGFVLKSSDLRKE
jgi:hypothetical protein